MYLRAAILFSMQNAYTVYCTAVLPGLVGKLVFQMVFVKSSEP